ncbi:hypothetical protein [Chromobacterium subtsugae]|uniref:hypothetical protein n=1 Tax=Chromobacterium subtsugae TaxID=251747 RepID=UPI00128AE547|nr:hypothetical protein [Chromobacterium subtsugae]
MLAGVLSLALLSACTTMQLAGDPLKTQPDANSGTVVLSLTLNTSQVGQMQDIELSRDEDQTPGLSTRYQLFNAVPGISRDTALFVGILPAGTYRFSQIGSRDKYLAVNDRQRELVGGFRVEAGKTVDLGRLVLTAANFKVVFGRSKLVPDNRRLVEAVAPAYRPLYLAPLSRGWLADNPADMVESYARGRPQGAGGFSELADHRVIGGSRLGSVIERDPDGRWRLLANTGGLDAVLSTAPYQDAAHMALAVGELGTFFKVRKDGGLDAVDRGNLPVGNYFFIDGAPDGKRWFVGVQLKGKGALYESERLDGGDWKLVSEDTTEFSFWSGLRGVWIWRYAGGVGYASTASRQVACFDYATGRWRRNGTPEGRGLLYLAGGPTPAIGVLTQAGGGLAGVFAKTHYTKDCGANWTETQSPYTVKVSAPLILPSGRILESGGVFGDAGIYRSEDGKAWTKISADFRLFGENVSVLPTVGLISVSNGAFGVEDVRHSDDDGANWQVEATSYDFRLAEKQKR